MIGRGSKNNSGESGSSWTPKQKAGQNGLNAQLHAARSAPVQGREVPEKARRAGRLDD